MKTIKQIAEGLGVSKQAVHRRINLEPLASIVRPHVVKCGRALTIDEQGVDLIKEAFEGGTVNVADVADVNNVNSFINRTDVVDVLKRELEERNSHIKTLAAQISELTAALSLAQSNLEIAQRNLEAEKQTSNAAQALHGATVKQYLETDATKPREKGFFARIFGKKTE